MGVLEILIVAVIALVVFGGYFRKRLPEFGRTAGQHARVGGEKAKELADQATGRATEVSGKVGEKVGERFDPATVGRTAGKHVREARELRDSFKGTLDPKPAPTEPPAVEPAPAAAEERDQAEPSGATEEQKPPG